MPVDSLEKQGERLFGVVDGWDGPESKGCDKWVVLLSTLLLRPLVEQGYPTPTLYPTPAGGVRAEWDARTQAYDVSVDFSDHVYFHALDLTTDEVDDERFEWAQVDDVLGRLACVLILRP